MEIRKAILDYVKVEEKISKNNKPYIALSVKIRGEDFFRNGFCRKSDEVFRATSGEEVLLKLYEEPWNDKMVKKVGVPSIEETLDIQLTAMSKRIALLEAKIGMGSTAFKPVPVATPMPGSSTTPDFGPTEPGDLDISDLPF